MYWETWNEKKMHIGIMNGSHATVAEADKVSVTSVLK